MNQPLKGLQTKRLAKRDGIGPRQATSATKPPAQAVARDRSATAPASVDVIKELLEPALWREGLEHYALATNVGVQLFDGRGEPIGECVNPQPLWTMLVTNRARAGGCTFSVSSSNICSCLTEAVQCRDTIFSRDRTGLVHFAVPLLLREQPIGGVLAGQVFDQYPETLCLDRAAWEAGLPPQQVWRIARQAHPIAAGTIRVYADLLTTLVNAILQARYSSILEAQRVEQLRQAQKLESIGILAGGVAHDFNNLLTAILGNASLILNELPPGHSAHAHAEEISGASQRAAGLTRQLLAYSGQGRFIVEPVDLSDLVRDMRELMRLSVSKGISLVFEIGEMLPAFEADATQIQQVVMNLIINAGEAIGVENQGAIVVRTGVEDLDAEYIRHTPAPDTSPGRYVFLEVQDSGCGMDETTLARVFEPFFTTKFTGRGLGLAAVWGIIRGHKGTAKIDSTIAQGTTFRVLFPATQKTAVKARPVLEIEKTQHGSGRILVVDDEAVVRNIARAVLNRHGYAVSLAEDGKTALDLFRSAADEISLVLLDMTMPGLSGHDTFLELKRIRPTVKVLLSSGYNEAEVSPRFAGEGLAGFIQKPYTFAALGEKIRTILESDARAEPKTRFVR